jgi:hypothetical protein
MAIQFIAASMLDSCVRLTPFKADEPSTSISRLVKFKIDNSAFEP